MRRLRRLSAVLLAALLLSFTAGSPMAQAAAPEPHAAATPVSHFIYMMQGDRTFDNYFGTFPGADGVPANACQELAVGHPKVGCIKPWRIPPGTTVSLSAGPNLVSRQRNDGLMNRFVAAFHSQGRDGSVVMGHYDSGAIPFYWSAAENYVLFDKFFASSPLGVQSNRNYWVAGAPTPSSNVDTDGEGGSVGSGYSQTTIFDRLQAAGVSWKFYVQNYQPQKAFKASTVASPDTQQAGVPLLNQPRFITDPNLSKHIVDLSQYYKDLASGNLPAVSYVATTTATERSARSLVAGEKLSKTIVTQLMLSKYWDSSAFLLSYDGSGGWYDHVLPPKADGPGYGLRVPALLVSPFTVQGTVNHSVFDTGSALAFIEQNWNVAPLGSRDAQANSLASAFNFQQAPRKAVLLPLQPTVSASAGSAPMTVYIAYTVALAIIAFFLTYAFVAPLGPVKSARARRDRQLATDSDEPTADLVEEPAQ